MPNDITTLAIEIQSQEAERSLRSFNEIMEASSRNAGKLEKISVEVDVQAALQQIQALKTGYDNLAASVQNIAGDIKLPGIAAPAAAPPIDTTALEALKEFFVSSAEMARGLREEVGQLAEAMKQSEVETIKVSTAGSGAVTVSREHAEALRELKAAQKELAAETAKADEAMLATVEADKAAENAERKLIVARRQLEEATKASAVAISRQTGNMLTAEVTKERLKAKVEALTAAYNKAQSDAKKFNKELEEHADKADAARAKVAALKQQLDGMPAPVAASGKQIGDFSQQLRNAGRDVTKVGRGVAYLGSMAGASIPGVSGLGRAIAMLGMGNPYLIAAGLAIAGIAAAVKMYNDGIVKATKAAKEFADIQHKIAEDIIAENKKVFSYIERIRELNSVVSMTNLEQREMAALINKVNTAAKYTALTYDAATGKIQNMIGAERELISTIIQRQKTQIQSEINARKAQVGAGEQEIADQFSSEAGFTLEAPFHLWTWLTNQNLEDRSVAMEYRRVKGIMEDFNDAFKRAQSASDKMTVLNQMEEFLIGYKQTYDGLYEALDLDDVAASVEKQREALKQLIAAEEQMDALNHLVGTRSSTDVNRNMRALETQLKNQRYAMLSDPDKYKADGEKLLELEKERQLFKGLNGNDIVTYKDKELTVNEALMEIELERLQIIRRRLAYEERVANAQNKGSKASLSGFMQAQRQEHNSLVNAVEANSVQRLALESRNFRTPENAFSKMVEETKKMSEETTRISKTLDEMKPLLVRITDGSETMSDALATLG